MTPPRVNAVTARFTAASNATFLGETADGTQVIYKPISGERPLWDFPAGTLAVREVLTYELSRDAGWDVVPETRVADGPYGPGAVQRFIETDAGFDPLQAAREADEAMWPLAVLDVVANNADRKLGHILRSGDRILGVDHGLTFHVEDKLRTVLWTFAGRPLPAELVASLPRARRALLGTLGDRIADALSARELEATMLRLEQLAAHPLHPAPPHDRPPLPWPPY